MSAIDERYEELGGADGMLGDPVTNEAPIDETDTIRYREYQHGAIYWWVRAEGGYRPGQHVASVCEVYGAIWDAFKAFGRQEGFLGAATSGETACHDGVGRFNTFQEGAIYWTPDTGAHEVHGAIGAAWTGHGAERGPLGYPTTDEGPCPDGVGRFNHFQNGSCYWTEATGAHEVQGAIHEKWAALGWETSFLGYPTSDEEIDSHGGAGRASRFQGGVISWTPETGAHEVHGAILETWTDLGAEQSSLGYPVTDEGSWIDAGRNEEVRISKFQHGEIDWTAKAGAAPWPNRYTFTLNRVRVLNTRSAHQDTDHVSLSVAVGNDPAQTVTHEIGDVNSGTYELDLSIGPISVRSRDDGLAVNYIVLNAGHASWDEINKALHDIGRFLAEKGAAVATAAVGTAIGASVGSGVMPVIGTAIGAVAGFIVGEVVGVLTADCDGVVAVEQGAFKGQDLWELTADGPHMFSTHHDGTDSPGGCGSNSVYEVDWTVSRAGP